MVRGSVVVPGTVAEELVVVVVTVMGVEVVVVAVVLVDTVTPPTADVVV